MNVIFKRSVKFLASFSYAGYLPWAPGTWGSLVALLIAWFFNEYLLWSIVIFSFIGLSICRPAEEAFNAKDPHRFVLDEVVGMMASVLFLPKRYLVFLAAFILFRVLDVLKPGPIGRIQASRTPSSIMWDDLSAGALVNILLQVSLRLIPCLRQ
ncbi:MAG: hypothetical protein AUJ71_04040 [Candidatus Omnitrophica bacterium CG1_02_49_16]|nr:MAG: hypothetical protein AUJ71_04040 [Candidatus Omnitrophica bacterium CG1_02_49_16]